MHASFLPPSADHRRPRSAVSHGVGLAGLIGLGCWLLVARAYGLDGPSSALVAAAACAVPMVLWSVVIDRVHERPSTGLDLSLRRPWRDTLDLTLTKLAGLWATWALIAAIYWIGRWYAFGSYPWAMGVLLAALPALVALSIPYTLWIDRRLVEPRDGCWHMGAAVTGQWNRLDRASLAAHARSWAVKGFFLAFMLSILPGGFAQIIATPLADMLVDPVAFASMLIAGLFVVDVMFATVGYLLTLRPLDAQIRSAEPTVAGWVAALICYPPFALMRPGPAGTPDSLFYAGPLHYETGTGTWGDWLAGTPVLLWANAVLLVMLTACYAWATVAFGLRFSNLTHRGILTHGPYALSRHPAYLSKNLFWWCSTLPFLAAVPADAVRNTVLMGLVSGVYYWRARTEERHLGRDPAYRAYFDWMEAHGPWPRATRRLFRRRSLEPVRLPGA